MNSICYLSGNDVVPVEPSAYSANTMKVLFLDESGDHNLSVIDPQYPLFVLGGIIVEKEYAEQEMSSRINQFKQEVFGTSDIVLHTADICRNRSGFERMKDARFRMTFYERINALMRDLEYAVVACVIKKDVHLAEFGVAALDPYLLSLDVLVERFCIDVGDIAGGGMIVAERRDPTLDHQLDLAWLNLKIQGTRFIQAKAVEKRIVGLSLRGKQENIAGLQLADLVISPIGRHVLGKTDKEDYQIIESKFRRNKKSEIEGYGLIVLPK